MIPSKEQEEHEAFIEKLNLDDQNVWARIILDDDDVDYKISNGDIILFSLINKEMIKMDKRFYETILEEQEVTFYYRPYVYGFMVKVNEYNKKIIEKIKKKYSRAYFHCTLSNSDGRYCCEHAIDGISFFSASPFRYKNKTLEFDENEDILEMYLDSWNKEKIKEIQKRYGNLDKNRLDDYLPSHKYNGKIKIYNVGQAACSYFISNSYRIMFDIGIDKEWLYDNSQNCKEETPAIIKKNYMSICRCSPKLVFLSHWDMDHILGVCLLRNRFPDLWVAPDVSERTNIYAGNTRLYAYLCYKHKLLIVTKEDNGKLFYSNNLLSIYKGTMKGKNKNNNHGIIVVIGGNDYMNERIIFPGDCEYAAWPEILDITQNSYEVLIVPHHGAKMTLGNHSLDNQSSEKKFAIFSYGEDNQYGHPNDGHVFKLNNIYNYEIVRVAEYQYIQIIINSDAYVKSIVLPYQKGYGNGVLSNILLRGSRDGN